jgi:protein kinase-like protein
MLFDPAEFVHRPLPDLAAVLQAHRPGDITADWQGRVELHGPALVDDATEMLSWRPLSLLTTRTDCRLPGNHPPVSLPGVVLQQYLGGGSQGWVYTARVEATGKHIAVKVLGTTNEARDQAAAREARICARLRHPNILRVFQVQPAGGYWIVLMELVQGSDLRATRVHPEQAQRCFGALADAVALLASEGIVHRDVKPSNVVLREPDHSPVLVDFGTAVDLRAPDESRPEISGTPFFMAPEAFRGSPPEPSWDAYGLGVTAAVVLADAYESYANLTTLRDAKASGDFDRRISTFLPHVSDPELRAWIGELVGATPAGRLAALDVARRWAVAA